MKFIRHNPRAQATDDQHQSARRLEEYRERCERTPEPIDHEEWVEMPTVARINEIFMRAPKPQKKLNYYVFGSGNGTWPEKPKH